MTDGGQLGRLLVFDRDAVGILDGHDQLHDVERIRAKIVRDVGVHGDGVFVHLKLVGKQFSHLFEHNTVSS